MPHLHSEFREMVEASSKESNIAALLLTLPTRTVTEGNYFRVVEDGRISYLPANRTPDYRDYFAGKGRMVGKPGKVIRKALPPGIAATLADEDYEQFANIVKAWHTLQGTARFHWYRGADIARLYHVSYHDKRFRTGSLGSSCMAHHEAETFDLYATTPEVELLILCKGEETETHIGRALVWTVDGQRYMDRIYGSDATIEAFRTHAREAGIATQYNNQSWYMPDGERELCELSITLARLPEQFPYLDTMRYLNVHERRLTNQPRSGEGWVELGSTDGGWFGRVVVRCAEDGCDNTIWDAYDQTELGADLESAVHDLHTCYACRARRAATSWYSSASTTSTTPTFTFTNRTYRTY